MTRGEQRAARFTDIAARYGVRLTAYVSRCVPVDDIPDVIASTLLTAWRRASLMPSADEEAFWWLLAIARRTVANHRRGIIRRTQLADRLRAVPVVAQTIDIESRLAVNEAIAGLPEDDRELIRLVYWDGLAINAAARVLGIGEAAARKRLQRVRSALRATLTTNAAPPHQLNAPSASADARPGRS